MKNNITIGDLIPIQKKPKDCQNKIFDEPNNLDNIE